MYQQDKRQQLNSFLRDPRCRGGAYASTSTALPRHRDADAYDNHVKPANSKARTATSRAFLTVCLGCLPLAQNWQVSPPPPAQCSMRMHDVWISTVLNVSTDLLILTIPIPTLWTSSFTTGRKIGLTLLLCSGLFVMSAAVIRFGFTIIGSTSVSLNKYVMCSTCIFGPS